MRVLTGTFLALCLATLCVSLQANVISGRILNGRGQPVPGIRINAMRVEYVEGRRGLAQAMSGTTLIQAVTDDHGEYRLFGLTSGDYYLTVPSQAYGTYWIDGPSIPNPNPDPSLPTVAVYYPGTTELRDAEPLLVRGTETRARDIVLPSTGPVRGVTVSGTIRSTVVLPPPPPITKYEQERLDNLRLENPTGEAWYLAGREGASTTYTGYLVPLDLNVLRANGGGLFNGAALRAAAGIGDKSDFVFGSVPPGSYDLVLVNRGAKVQSEPITLEIGNSDISGLEAVVRKLRVDGRVSVSPGGRPFDLIGTHIELLPIHRRYRLPYASAKNSGDFTFGEIASGRYDVIVSELPDDAYVERISYAGHISDIPQVTIAGDPGLLEVVVNPAGAAIAGRVVDRNGGSAANAEVVLVPDRETLRSFATAYKRTTTDADGRFTLRGIAPGDYEIFAWASVPETAWMNPAFLSAYADKGRSVQVLPAATVSTTLTLIEP